MIRVVKTPNGSASHVTVKSVLFAAGALLVLLIAPPRAARAAEGETPAFPRFPVETTSAAIAAWLKQSTSVNPADVILVGDGAVLAIEPGPAEVTADGTKFTRLREELTSAKLERRLGGRSSTVSVSFDCTISQYKLSNPLVFKGSNLLGGPGVFMDPGDWLKASPDWGFALPKVFCGSGFKHPLEAAVSAAPEPPREQPSPTPASVPTPALRPASGAYWVQAGAYPSVAAADAEWARLKALVPGSRVGHRTEAVNRPSTLYRLLIGPYDTKPLALSTCEALKRSKMACFVR